MVLKNVDTILLKPPNQDAPVCHYLLTFNSLCFIEQLHLVVKWILIWRINELVSAYLTELISFKTVAKQYNMWSSGESLLQQPTIRTLATVGDCFFDKTPLTFWNSLSVNIHETTNVKSFKRMLEISLAERFSSNKYINYHF